MILQELVRHYETLAGQGKVSPGGWCQAKVSHALELAADGSLLGIISLKQEEVRGKKTLLVPSILEVPQMVGRTVGVAANFLCDNSKYILGIDSEGASQQNMKRFEAAKEKHLELLRNVENEVSRAVKNFYLTWKPELAAENTHMQEKWEDITSGGNLVFYVNRVFAQEDGEIREAWQRHLNREEEDEEKICLVTGKKDRIARTHGAIKGVQGAQPSGALLVSFNEAAFESYGKKQSYNAPVGKYAVFAYTTALNYLLAQREYVFTLGDAAVVFWVESGEEAYQRTFLNLMESKINNQKEIKGFFEKVKAGRFIDVEGMQLDPKQKFYILGLSPNAARLSVRFFYQNTFGAIISNIQRHYDEMEIIRPAWEEREYLGIWHLVMETANPKARDKKPQAGMAAGVFEAVLSGKRYPESLYANVLIRIRAEQGGVSWGRAEIIKAHLIRNYGNWQLKEGKFVALNEGCGHVAYILGREFAVLEKIQKDANPNIKATIKDRYFNAAGSTPEMVFPVLFRLKESHIRKIQNEGQKRNHENMLTELQGKIEVREDAEGAYPKRLSLEEQGLFILGYYHQVQKLYETKEEK